MCQRPLELVSIPILALISICLSSFTLTQERWLTAFTEQHLIYATISPFYICALDCPGCNEKTVSGTVNIGEVLNEAESYYNNNDDVMTRSRMEFVCFWMADWGATGFGEYRLALSMRKTHSSVGDNLNRPNLNFLDFLVILKLTLQNY